MPNKKYPSKKLSYWVYFKYMKNKNLFYSCEKISGIARDFDREQHSIAP